MTVEELLQARAKAEAEILAIVCSLEERSGVKVTGIELAAFSVARMGEQGPKRVVGSARISMEL